VLRYLLLILILLTSAASAETPRDALEAALDAPTVGAFRAHLEGQPELDRLAKLRWPQPARAEAAAMLENARATENAPPTTRYDRTRRSLERTLASSEFQDERTRQHFIDRIVAFIAGLFDGFFHGHASGPLMLLIYALLATAGVIAVATVVTLFLNRKKAPRQVAVRGRSTQDRARRIPTAAEWLASARAHQDRGERREALHCLYLALLRRLHELELARVDSGQTNWEIVRQLGGDPRHPAMVEATRLFESRWYAMRPIEPDDFDHILRAWPQ
jgi:hypothetical protein